MLKVLVVDNEPTARRGIILSVDWGKMDCVIAAEAANGLEGLEAAERYNPGLIITAVGMPQMDGPEMIRRLRERGCQARVILLPTGDEAGCDSSALGLEAAEYLRKPFREQELIDAVERICRREAQAEGAGKSDSPSRGGKSKYVMQTISHIARHYSDTDIGIAAIAGALGISEGHLSHVFKKETSFTVIAYLTQYRIHKAMELLRTGKHKVYEVADLVGYRDVAYFSSTFKKTSGLSPSEYQERIRNLESEGAPIAAPRGNPPQENTKHPSR